MDRSQLVAIIAAARQGMIDKDKESSLASWLGGLIRQLINWKGATDKTSFVNESVASLEVIP